MTQHGAGRQGGRAGVPRGNGGGFSPPHPPLGGGRGRETTSPPAPLSPAPSAADRSAWLADQMHQCAAFVADLTAAFGRDAFRVTFADEAGHRIGKRDTDAGLSLAEIVVGPALPAAVAKGRK